MHHKKNTKRGGGGGSAPSDDTAVSLPSLSWALQAAAGEEPGIKNSFRRRMHKVLSYFLQLSAQCIFVEVLYQL